jgi:hypothetical protein
VDAILQTIAEYLAYLAQVIANWVIDKLGKVFDWLSGLAQKVYEFITSVFSRITVWLNEALGQIVKLVNDVINQVLTYLNTIWDKVVQVTIGVIDTIAGFVSSVRGKLEALIQVAIEKIAGWIGGVTDFVSGLVDAGLNAIADAVEAVKVKVTGWIDKALKFVVDVYDAALQKIKAGIDELLGGSGSLIETIGERLGSLGEAFGEAFGPLADNLKDFVTEQFEPLRKAVVELFDSVLGDADPVERAAISESLDRFAKGPITPELIREFWGEGWSRLVPDSGWGSKAFFAVAALGGILMLVANTASIQAQVLQQDLALSYPWLRMGAADASLAWRRGAIDRDKAVDYIQRQGFTRESAEQMLDNSATLPSVGEMLASWLRGDLGEKGLDDALFQLGLSPGMAGNLKALAEIIPPVQDLIVMAVREVFSPIAEEFGQFEDYPEELTQWAEKQGLSKEWARRYWAAHWSLPSPNQGFEMLHRGVIKDTDELKKLLRALDVMPRWRQPLIDIAYSPFTRVDIRRMHQLGILDDDAVLKAHKEIGYDDTKAGQLTQFVLKLNRNKPAENDEELGRLSRSAILGFFADGIIDEGRASQLLIGLGHTPEAAALYVQSEKLDKQRQTRREEADHIIELAGAGSIGFSQAQDRLTNLGLSRLEVESALTKLIRLQEKTVKLPTRAEAASMYDEQVITESDYRDVLSRLGYAPRWVNAFVGLAKGKQRAG